MNEKEINSLFLFGKIFPKKLFIPKKYLSKYLCLSQLQYKSRKCFNIGLIRTVNLAKIQFF